MMNSVTVPQQNKLMVGIGLSLVKYGLEIVRMLVTIQHGIFKQSEKINTILSEIDSSLYQLTSAAGTIELPEHSSQAFDYFVQNVIKSSSQTPINNEQSFYRESAKARQYEKILAIIEPSYPPNGKAMFNLMGMGVENSVINLPLNEASLLLFLVKEREQDDSGWLDKTDELDQVIAEIRSIYNFPDNQPMSWTESKSRYKQIIKRINRLVQRDVNIEDDLIIRSKGQFRLVDSIGGISIGNTKLRGVELIDSEYQFIFKLMGDYWWIHYKYEQTLKKDSKGLNYIHSLLKAPNKGVLSDILNKSTGDQPTTIPDGLVGDKTKEEDTRYPIPDLKDIKDSAVFDSEIEKAKIELEALAPNTHEYDETENKLEHLKYVRNVYFNKSGEERIVDAGTEKSRQAVSRAIDRAIKDINKDLPELALYFKQNISKGHECIYDPLPGSRIDWQL